MRTLSIKIDKTEEEYLSRVAEKNNLFSGGNNEPSLGKALKKLAQWCAFNDMDISKSHDVFDEDMRKMIEQIHVAIPNLMYLSRMDTLFNSEEIPKETAEECKKKSLDYINSTCGAFQYANYKSLRVSINAFGMKQIPSDKETSLWK
jgi:hypothetical protein